MKIVIGCDHRGFALKEFLKEYLLSKYDVIDVGGYDTQRTEYPNVAQNLANVIKTDVQNTLGIIICGSGVGVCVAVNKFNFIRGALVYNKNVAISAKQHNNANVLCLGADHNSKEDAVDYLEAFLSTQFEGGRHLDRIKALEWIAK